MAELIIRFLDEPIPSKKNSKQIIYNKKLGRSMLISSSKYLKWNKANVLHIKNQYKGKPIEECNNIEIGIVYKTKHRKDLSNTAESIMDTLVDAGILIDDNHFVTGSILLRPFLRGITEVKINYDDLDKLHETFSV